jgi:septum formation protein
MKLILASNSPRRRDILTNGGFSFEVICSDYEENSFSSDPVLTAQTFAYGKAKSVFDSLENKSDYLVLGADTVVYNGSILGKGKDAQDAKNMLKTLSNKTHTVITGYALISTRKEIVSSVKTQVTFNDLTDKLIDEYVSSGLYKGKAGCYGIQDPFPLVAHYNGSLSNVIGLPEEEIFPQLKELLK